MNDTPVHEQTLIHNLIAELTAVPVVTAATPARTLEVPRPCLLREWMELYWTALERPEFLDWASRFHIDLDTLQIKGDILQARTPANGTSDVRTFTLEDDSGWWQVAPMLQSISQRIDPAGLGLPYIGGKSANPLYRFPRQVVLAFYGYPEPQNQIQARVILTEMKKTGLAAIDENGHSTSAVVKERNAQLEDFRAIADQIDAVLLASDPFEQRGFLDTPVTLASASVSAPVRGPRLKLGELLRRYEFALPEDAGQAKALAQRLRQHSWPELPYVSDYVQTGTPIRSYREDFGDLEDVRHIGRRLEDLSWNKAPKARIDYEEFSEPHPDSTLAVQMALGQERLQIFSSNADFQAILQQHGLPADSQLLVTESGHVGTASAKGWVNLTTEVEKHSDLKLHRDQLKAQAGKAGGALRSSGKVTLGQMLRFYELPSPKTVEQALSLAKWDKINLHMRPGHMNQWYLLGQPWTKTERFTAQQRQSIIDTTQAFLPEDSPPLIDYLSEGVDTDLPLNTLKAKADYLISRILITSRARTLGNQLVKNLGAPSHKKRLLATNRERLLLAALILNLEPSAGEDINRIVAQRLEGSDFWGDSYDEVRRFIDRQPQLALVKNKTLATHLLLSGISPEFLIRGIPRSLPYMSCLRWVRLKQVVLYIERRLPGAARLMTYEQLRELTKGPAPADFYKFLREEPCASVVVDWAVARGLIQRDADFQVTVYDAATLKQADLLFRNHNRLIYDFYRRAFQSSPPTPATIALADLRKIFADSPHLTEKALFVPASDADTTGPHYSLSQLHIAGKLTGDMQGWQSSNAQLQLPSMIASLPRLNNVASAFHAALAARLKHMKDAHVAILKEAFCRLPLAQRLDLEDNTLELLALRPVSAATDKLAKAGTAPFGILALLHGRPTRVFEIFTSRDEVVLRRDIDIALLKPSVAKEAAKTLPLDAEAYKNGSKPRLNATCKAFITRLDIEGAPLAQQARTAVPDTFASNRVNAIASTAVRHLFDAYEAKALQDALRMPELEDAAASHEKWLAFYQKLSPPKR
ncbi:hypothetical protein BR1R3_38480 [Pseudomonas atacamensis]|jgi:hypothetical protein|uniref:hypothetical protein n=1 Tax=Pseudomonas atacamensis TaxID=2565368 RepID=UPI0022BB90B4|nr:hypothetical protein [Pseudomonas atacamensis]GLH21106.1 hypothetical protein BR1R3_38480 [Pseudomonas atacamensis]